MSIEIDFPPLFRRSSNSIHNCIIVSTDTGEWLLVNSSPSLLENDVFDGLSLEDNLSNGEMKKLPTESGVYKCEINVYSYQCNRYDDPEEWDLDLTIHNIEPMLIFP